VLIEHYGLTPRQYSIAFAANAASFIVASQFTSLLSARLGLVPMVRFAVVGFVVVMALLFISNLLGIDQLTPMLVMLFIGYSFLGLILPSTSVLALEAHGAISGTASALMGTLQFVTGAAVMGVMGLFVDGSARPMVAGIAGCAALVLLVTWRTLGVFKESTAPAAPSSL
jgi:DHA1 family bicyclomycin/chloramphenicol resistance-like MFS transporter